MFKLVICDDEGKTTLVPLIRDEVTIGRREGNTIRLTDRNISRRHAHIIRNNDNTFSIEDLGSRNGTKVNGDHVMGEPMPLIPGDQVYVGDYNLSIRTDVSAGVPMGTQMAPGDSAGIGKVTTHARLVLISGKDAGKEFDLTVDLFVVGRSDEANLKVDDPSLSRAHARLDGDDHKWTISDLDSINGIMINGQKRDDYLLKSGDVIELGVVKFRYVPPGEPYEYNPEKSSSSDSKPKFPSKFAMILTGVAVAAILAITMVFMGLGNENENNDGGVANMDADEQRVSQLIEKGKDYIQAEEWEEAARTFVEVQQKDPNNRVAKELKKNAIFELEAQEKYLTALEAEKKKDWSKAVKALSVISRSSHYYDIGMLRRMSANLCEELLDKAAFMGDSDNLNGARKTLSEIEVIPEMSASCGKRRDQLTLQYQKDGNNSILKRTLKPTTRKRNRINKKRLSTNPYSH